MKRIALLDYARLFAAFAVMLFHYFYAGMISKKISSISHIESILDVVKYGYLGVEFFFIISGYVIFYSASNRAAGEFLSSRCVRLFPAFWGAATITSIAAQQWGTGALDVSLTQFLANLTMFPDTFGEHYVDGVYWTLKYEWKFYSAVFLILFIFGSSFLKRALIIWPFYIALDYFFLHKGLPLTKGYFAYFAAGALFAILRENRNWAAVLALLVAAGICLDFSAHNALKMAARFGYGHSPIVVMIAILGMFGFFGALNLRPVRNLDLPGSRIAGSLSYPLYLIHAHLGYMLISAYATESNKLWTYLWVASLAVLWALFIHLIVEQKGAPLWRKLSSLIVAQPTRILQKIYSDDILRKLALRKAHDYR